MCESVVATKGSGRRIICKWLVNSSEFSDVKFLVGPNKETVYAHKLMLASGSLVFEKYFFAEHSLKMDADSIEVPDLSVVGFINMLKFFYGYEVTDLDLSELFETFLAADKYLVDALKENLLEHAEATLNSSNCCIIYDQLLKLGKADVVNLSYVKKMINVFARHAFISESFTKIDMDTLIDILEFETLNIEEIDVLKSCLRWAEAECSRNGIEPFDVNTREILRPIMRHICFTNLSIEQIREFDQIERVLNAEEIGSLVVHLFNRSKKLAIECKPCRNTWELDAVEEDGAALNYNDDIYARPTLNYQNRRDRFNDTHVLLPEITFNLDVNHEVLIRSIITLLPISTTGLKLSILENGKRVESVEKQSANNLTCTWELSFEDFIHLKPHHDYRLTFIFTTEVLNRYKLSQNTKLLSNDHTKTEFNLRLEKYHCIKKMEFYVMPQE